MTSEFQFNTMAVQTCIIISTFRCEVCVQVFIKLAKLSSLFSSLSFNNNFSDQNKKHSTRTALARSIIVFIWVIEDLQVLQYVRPTKM